MYYCSDRGEGMKKNGFTLTEILGVIVILGLLFLIVAPPVINQVSSHKTEVTSLQKQMIEEAAGLYLDSHSESFPACIEISTLKEAGYLNDSIKGAADDNLLSKKVNVTLSANGTYSSEIKDSC